MEHLKLEKSVNWSAFKDESAVEKKIMEVASTVQLSWREKMSRFSFENSDKIKEVLEKSGLNCVSVEAGETLEGKRCFNITAQTYIHNELKTITTNIII